MVNDEHAGCSEEAEKMKKKKCSLVMCRGRWVVVVRCRRFSTNASVSNRVKRSTAHAPIKFWGGAGGTLVSRVHHQGHVVCCIQ